MKNGLKGRARVRVALVVLAAIGCGKDRLPTSVGTGRGGSSAGATGGTTGTGGIAGTTGSGGAAGVGADAGSGGFGAAGRGADDIGPPATCPPGTETPLSSPVIADFASAGSDGLPALAAPFRAYVTSNVTSEVGNGTWHLKGDKVQGGPVAYPVKLGIDFGCVDASAYAGVSFTIDTTGSSCYGVSTTIYDASAGTLDDEFGITGQTKTTVKIPFAQMWFNGQRAVHAIEWAALSVDSCRSEIRMSDLRFYSAAGSGGRGGTAGTTGAGGSAGTSGAGANDGACPPSLETSLSSPLAADFSKGSSGRLPVLEPGYSALVLDYQLPLTSEITDGAWHVAGTALGPSGSAGRADISVGIVFPCVDPSRYSGISFTIDGSGATCTALDVWLTDVYGRSYSRGVGAQTKLTVQIPWPVGFAGWAGLKRVMWRPYNSDVTRPCQFDWKIDDVGFY